MQLLALPILAATVLVIVLIVDQATPSTPVDPWKYVLPVFPFVIVVHELLHALVHPRFGTTAASILGVWPSRMLFYAHYEGELSRNRFLAILLAPTVVLTLIPLAVIVALQLDAPLLTALALANGIGACGDVLGVLLVTFQIPSQAIVRNQGWRSYWRPRSEEPSGRVTA